MVTRRAMMIYNFGIALILVAVGVVTLLFSDVAAQQSARLTALPTFDGNSRQAIEEQEDIEQLRQRSLFYFELARELKVARNADTTRYFYETRTTVLILAALFALGGVMGFAAQDPVKEGSTQ